MSCLINSSDNLIPRRRPLLVLPPRPEVIVKTPDNRDSRPRPKSFYHARHRSNSVTQTDSDEEANREAEMESAVNKMKERIAKFEAERERRKTLETSNADEEEEDDEEEDEKKAKKMRKFVHS